jgi:hypothetical protein
MLELLSTKVSALLTAAIIVLAILITAIIVLAIRHFIASHR